MILLYSHHRAAQGSKIFHKGDYHTMENKMFCYQCQETAGCSGCTISGVCGKRPDVSAMQDLLVYVTKGLSAVTTQMRREGLTVPSEVSHLVSVNLFTTITNANFDKDAITAQVRKTLDIKQSLLSRIRDTDLLPEAAFWADSEELFSEKAETVGVLSTENEDIRSLRELITYGLKGLAAYTRHANALLAENEEIDALWGSRDHQSKAWCREPPRHPGLRP